MLEYVGYVGFHARRYQHLLKTMYDCYEDGGSIAIFGPSGEYAHIKEHFPESSVTIYGKEVPPLEVPPDELIYIDFNEPNDILEHYDIGVCCEVVEHLTRPLSAVLNDMLRCCDIVVIQTPNARSLHARLKCAFFQSPFQYVAYTRSYGHVYEYTLEELTTGLPVMSVSATNYFGGSTLLRRVYNTIASCLPKTWRDGFTIVYRGYPVYTRQSVYQNGTVCGDYTISPIFGDVVG